MTNQLYTDYLWWSDFRPFFIFYFCIAMDKSYNPVDSDGLTLVVNNKQKINS